MKQPVTQAPSKHVVSAGQLTLAHGSAIQTQLATHSRPPVHT